MGEQYPKRLIEVDLPIKRISEHARREKSIRHGHISTLHMWWARRPLAACRAVLCAALWPDPADPLCPDSFREAAKHEMLQWSKYHMNLLSGNSLTRFVKFGKDYSILDDRIQLRKALLDFISDFSNWDNSTNDTFLRTSRSLTQFAHEALGGISGTKPLVVDPFAGGGSIPLEALRIDADSFSSDLNPVAVLLNKVVLEYVPRYGEDLAAAVRKWGEWIKQEAYRELGLFYPQDPDGFTPIAYIWAKTIICEGPNCGAEIPLLRSLALVNKGNRSVTLRAVCDTSKKWIGYEILRGVQHGHVTTGTVRRGAVTCPICGFTTSVTSVRKQLKKKDGGTTNPRLIAVLSTKDGVRRWRLPIEQDHNAVRISIEEIDRIQTDRIDGISLVPDEYVNPLPHSVNRLPMYGMSRWRDAYTPRQLLSLSFLVKKIRLISPEIDQQFCKAILTCLALAVSRCTDYWSSLATWAGDFVAHTFGRQALPFITDFVEVNALSEETGSWSGAINWITRFIDRESTIKRTGVASILDATNLSLPDGVAQVYFTDPPYYDAISYADLSDYFYVWLRRCVGNLYPELFAISQTPKSREIIVESTEVEDVGIKDAAFYLENMSLAMQEGRRILDPSGIGIVVFAHKSTSGWESQLEGMLRAGLKITASWPIDTERPGKVSGIGQARLMSSIHLVFRPRDITSSDSRTGDIGDWRDVLQEFPLKIKEWLPRLAKEGIVGADAIFACLGPALEIFSRYSIVEKASGEQVYLREYLEHVWAAVSKEALNMIFEGADATGFEEDARLTAMWLWTLSTGINGNEVKIHQTELELDGIDEDDGEGEEKKSPKISGFVLEYDAARKIAQGLGAHLENLTNLVEIKGSNARLLPVSDRAEYLFGKKEEKKIDKPKAKGGKQLTIADIIGKTINESQPVGGTKIALTHGKTTLDHIHQSMLLFGLGESGYLKKLLVEDGAGADPRFWRLAQALSALYPSTTAEKRWIDGVLARKKTLGF